MGATITFPPSGDFKLIVPRATIVDNTEIIEIANIPQTHKHLKLLILLLAEAGATGTSVFIQFNSDLTSGNYAQGGADRNGGGWTAGGVFDATLGMWIAYGNSKTAPYTQPTLLEIDIFNYSSSVYYKKVWTHGESERVTLNTMRETISVMDYKSLTPISNIKFDSGIGNAWDSPGYYEIYGMGKV